jgi:nucleoside-triphosphatase THEP1
LLGRPGIGKTTMLREVARVLADNCNKRVIVVDTSNEIAGDGDIPHPAIGHARRMQVPSPTMQHAVMIEAVENHMPQVIIVDEIGTSLEAEAARTIAERGVQLIGTAHGNSLENLTNNPTLSDLIGGIQTVTLGDEEARRRHTQKSVLERKAPPTFDILVEIQERDQVIVHPDVGEAVDAILHSGKIKVEMRKIDPEGNVIKSESILPDVTLVKEKKSEADVEPSKYKMYLFGVNRNKLEEAARERHIGLKLVTDIKEANLLLTTKNYYLRKPQLIRDAEKLDIPIYAVRSSNPSQLRHCLDDIYWHKKEILSETRKPRDAYGSPRKPQTPDNGSYSSYIQDLQAAIDKHSDRKGFKLTRNPFRKKVSKN